MRITTTVVLILLFIQSFSQHINVATGGSSTPSYYVDSTSFPSHIYNLRSDKKFIILKGSSGVDTLVLPSIASMPNDTIRFIKINYQNKIIIYANRSTTDSLYIDCIPITYKYGVIESNTVGQFEIRSNASKWHLANPMLTIATTSSNGCTSFSDPSSSFLADGYTYAMYDFVSPDSVILGDSSKVIRIGDKSGNHRHLRAATEKWRPKYISSVGVKFMQYTTASGDTSLCDRMKTDSWSLSPPYTIYAVFKDSIGSGSRTIFYTSSYGVQLMTSDSTYFTTNGSNAITGNKFADNTFNVFTAVVVGSDTSATKVNTNQFTQGNVGTNACVQVNIPLDPTRPSYKTFKFLMIRSKEDDAITQAKIRNYIKTITGVGTTESTSWGDVNTWVLAGQSNADGRAASSSISSTYTIYKTAPTAPDSNNYIFNRTTRKFVQYVPASTGMATGGSTYFGVENGFMRYLHKYKSTPTYMIKFARGGTAIEGSNNTYPGCWKSTISNSLTDTLLYNVKRANRQFLLDGKKMNVVGIIWIQGSNDGLSEAYANAYSTNLSNLMTKLSTKFNDYNSVNGFSTNLTYLIGTDYDDGTVPYFSTVISAQQDFCNGTTKFYIDQSQYPSVGLHYGADMLVKIGIDAAYTVKDK